jgi:prepilin-type N-terminal cleavage/methylation domain-containing protein
MQPTESYTKMSPNKRCAFRDGRKGAGRLYFAGIPVAFHGMVADPPPRGPRARSPISFDLPMALSRRGFSLIEVLVGLTIIVTLAAVLTPNLVTVLDRARIDRAVASLEHFVQAVQEFEEDVNRYPSRLSQLAEPVSDSDADACGQRFPPGLAKQWGGPYLSRLVPSGGVPIAIGTARNQLETGVGTLSVVVPRVTEEDALELNARIDGDQSGSANSVRWTAPDDEGMVALSFVIPIKRC